MQGLQKAEKTYGTINIAGSGNVVLGDIYNIHQPLPSNVSVEREALRELLDKTSYPGIQHRFHTLKGPHSNTFKWIWTHSYASASGAPEECQSLNPVQNRFAWDSFSDWIEHGSTPYWISGKLGSGKSTLMKYIVETCSSDSRYNHNIVLSHFFWEAGAELQRSILGCLRSLTYQLLQHLIEEQGPQCQLPLSVFTQSISHQLTTILQSIDKTVLIFLDGLDECPETDDVLDLVDTLGSLKGVKLCIASRPEEAYRLHLSSFPKLKLQHLNSRDIRQVIRKELLENNRIQRSNSWNPVDAAVLAGLIEHRAEGVFLWVRLAIKDLLRGWTNRDDLLRMRRRLEKMPQDIYRLYTHIIRRNEEDLADYANEAALYFRLLDISPTHGLPLISFTFATHDGVRAQWLESPSIYHCEPSHLEQQLDCAQTAIWVNVRTAGLLEVRESEDTLDMALDISKFNARLIDQFGRYQVEFVHRSAHEYLYNTFEGRQLISQCPSDRAEIEMLYFQCQLITFSLVPAVYGFCLGSSVFTRILPESTNKNVECYVTLQRIYDELYDVGLIRIDQAAQVDQLPHLYYDIGAFPSSVHHMVDIRLVLAGYGLYEWFEPVLNQHPIGTDHRYMSRLKSNMILHNVNCGKDIVPLLADLSSSVSKLGLGTSTPNPSDLCLAFELMSLTKHDKDYGTQVWAWVNHHFRDHLTKFLPLSTTAVLNMLSFEAERFNVVLSLSASTMKAWDYGLDHDRRALFGRAHIFASKDHDSWEFRAIHPDDSQAVLETVWAMHAARPTDTFHNSIRYAGGMHLFSPASHLVPDELGELFKKSRSFEALADCLLYVGEPQDAIDVAIKTQIHIAKHEPSYCANDVLRFRKLLGTDPIALARWCNKYPELHELLIKEKIAYDQYQEEDTSSV